METSTLLIIFLATDVLLLGVVATLAARHGRAHLRGSKANTALMQQLGPIEMPESVKHRIIEAGEANYTLSLKRSAAELQRDLDHTTDGISRLLEKMGTEVVGNELERYRKELAELRKQASDNLHGINASVAEHEVKLRQQLKEDIGKEKQRILSQIDTRLGDAAIAFLSEAMQNNIDLGAQRPYLLQTLEEHKAEIQREVANGDI